MKYNICSTVSPGCRRQFEFGRAIAHPSHCIGLAGLIRTRYDFDVVGNHERRVKAQPELADDVFHITLVLEFFHELRRAREGNLVDVLLDLLASHPDTTIADGDGLRSFIKTHVHTKLAEFSIELSHRSQFLKLLSCINGIRHQLTKEYLMIGIQEFLDDRENVLGMYRDGAFFCYFCHDFVVMLVRC